MKSHVTFVCFSLEWRIFQIIRGLGQASALLIPIAERAQLPTPKGHRACHSWAGKECERATFHPRQTDLRTLAWNALLQGELNTAQPKLYLEWRTTDWGEGGGVGAGMGWERGRRTCSRMMAAFYIFILFLFLAALGLHCC